MKAFLNFFLITTFILGVISIPNAFAVEDCPRGTLDKRYCDRNGDLVADNPTDSSKWVDPSTIIFAYAPVEDPAVYRGVWADFLDHMTNVTGKKVVFFPVQSNAAQIESDKDVQAVINVAIKILNLGE